MALDLGPSTGSAPFGPRPDYGFYAVAGNHTKTKETRMTRKTIGITWLVALLVGLVAIACSSASGAGFQDTDSGRQIAVVLAGTATGETRDINGSPMECFDVNLLDPANGKVIGNGTDCLDLASIEMIGDDGGMLLNNTTFFKFDDGTIVSLSLTAAQPVSDPLPTSGPTHITGEISGGDNILAEMGTGKYAGIRGSTRLSGMVDMSAFSGPGTQVTFDCIFVINLAKS